MEADKFILETDDIKKLPFLEHLFMFNDSTKGQLFNILQYTVIAIIPVLLLNKGISHLIPKVNDQSPNYLLAGEVVGQAVLMFGGIFMIHRFVTFFPTYSKLAYEPFHITNIIILFLVIAASFQTRIGEKTNILIDRMFDIIEGRTSLVNNTSAPQQQQQPQHQQPQHQQQQQQPQYQQQQPQMPSVPQHQPSRIDNATNISNLQSNNDQMPDYNSMFSGPNNPMVNANTPNT